MGLTEDRNLILDEYTKYLDHLNYMIKKQKQDEQLFYKYMGVTNFEDFINKVSLLFAQTKQENGEKELLLNDTKEPQEFRIFVQYLDQAENYYDINYNSNLSEEEKKEDNIRALVDAIKKVLNSQGFADEILKKMEKNRKQQNDAWLKAKKGHDAKEFPINVYNLYDEFGTALTDSLKEFYKGNEDKQKEIINFSGKKTKFTRALQKASKGEASTIKYDEATASLVFEWSSEFDTTVFKGKGIELLKDYLAQQKFKTEGVDPTVWTVDLKTKKSNSKKRSDEFAIADIKNFLNNLIKNMKSPYKDIAQYYIGLLGYQIAINSSKGSIKGALGELESNVRLGFLRAKTLEEKEGITDTEKILEYVARSVIPLGVEKNKANYKDWENKKDDILFVGGELPIDTLVEIIDDAKTEEDGIKKIIAKVGFQVKEYNTTGKEGEKKVTFDGEQNAETLVASRLQVPKPIQEVIFNLYGSIYFSEGGNRSAAANNAAILSSQILHPFGGRAIGLDKIMKPVNTEYNDAYNTFFIINGTFIPSSIMLQCIYDSLKDGIANQLINFSITRILTNNKNLFSETNDEKSFSFNDNNDTIIIKARGFVPRKLDSKETLDHLSERATNDTEYFKALNENNIIQYGKEVTTQWELKLSYQELFSKAEKKAKTMGQQV